MKNLIYFLALFFAVIYAASCDTKPVGPEVYTPTPDDVISEATYDLWVGQWKANGKSYIANQDTLLKYFTLPLIDLEEFLNHPGNGPDTLAASRFVLGMEINGTDTMPHIMLVGVNSAGESLTDASRQQYIYDVSLPCPSMCGAKSLPKN